MSESAGSSFIRKISGTLFIVALGFVMVAWIKVSQPFDPDQVKPASGRLDEIAIADAKKMPAFAGSVVTLAYHGVSDTDHAGTTLSRELFAEHMRAMKTAGFQTVTLDQVQKLVNGESVELPPKALLLTFDGGHITDWTNVDPVLKELGFNAVTFLTTSEIVQAGTPSYFLSFDQLKKLRGTGRWEFGSHTDDSANSVDVPGDVGVSFTNRMMVDGEPETPEQWDDRITADLARTQDFFKKHLGGPAVAFSYPNGDPRNSNNLDRIQVRTEKLLKSAGFDYAFYGEDVPSGQVDGVTKNSNRYRLPRIGVRSTTTVATLLKDVRGTIPAPPPANLTQVKWTGPYTVACQTLKGNLYVYSREYGNCKLDTVNTTRWRDYTLSTVIKAPINRQIAFFSVRDGEGATHTGSLVVAVGRDEMVVRQTLNGGDLVKELGKADLAASPTRTVAIKVSGTGPDNTLVVNITGMAQPLTVKFLPEIVAGGVKFGVDGYLKPLTFFKPQLKIDQEVAP
ncbi:polysaccharide deacetylase family protein [Actinocorallia longicatena]|uniref:NodB homology domain-containing protein n=1 Tax=Actinocorallia longicatena TaxID=111803 RepID=A0ABP6QGZ0_9ACTN